MATEYVIPREFTLETAAIHWDRLAAAEEADFISMCAVERAKLYRRTAESLRIEQRTGVAVCPCCFKPYGRRP